MELYARGSVFETTGMYTDITDDNAVAEVGLRVEDARGGTATPVILKGTPKQLRAFARGILEGLRRER